MLVCTILIALTAQKTQNCKYMLDIWPKPKVSSYFNPFLVLEAFFYGTKSGRFFLKEFFLDAEIQLMHILTYCTNFL